MAEMSQRLGIAPIQPQAASWPVGVSLLAQMIDACQRCEAEPVCNDWLVRAPDRIEAPPAFCPNADGLKQAKR